MKMLICLLSLPAALAAGAEDPVLSTKVGDVDVQLFVPAEVRPLRGLYVHAANYKLKPNDRWAEAGRVIGFGHIALNINLKATNRPAKLRAALDEALKEFAEKTGRRELLHVPLAGAGHSAGGMVSPVLLKTPERALTLCIDCGWITDPAKLNPVDSSVPMLFTLGAVPDAFKMLPGIEANFVPARKADMTWGLGVQWGCAHDFGNSATLMIPWIEAVAAARIPSDADPAAGPPVLKAVKPQDGWLGDRSTTSGNWAVVAPYSEFSGDKGQAAWFPSRAVAFVWRAWQSKESPVQLEAADPDGKAALPPFAPKSDRSLIVNPNSALRLGLAIKPGTAVAKVRWFDGDKLIGEAAAAPWELKWTPPAPGAHPVYAVWEGADGKPGTTNPALLVVRRSAVEGK